MAIKSYGLLGRKLGHSYSPIIYQELAGLDYQMYEREPEDIASFMREGTWAGLNVTMPYKRTVVEYLDELSPVAQRLGNVNTIVRMEDGRLFGDNTDYYGFKCLVESLGINVEGMRAVVFGGTGGAGATVQTVLADMGVEALSISRSGSLTYNNLAKLDSIDLAVNCTPAGMYPNCPDVPCSLDVLPNLKAVLDIVYNPARTGLMLQAEQLGIPHASGLLMLVGQAAAAVELYTGQKVSLERTLEVTQRLSATKQNIAIIGMPGCGKTRGGQALATLLGRTHVDIDHELEKRLGCSCSEYIKEHGEHAFRKQETSCLRDIAKNGEQVISCGGGVVVSPQNYGLLHQNSLIVHINRPLTELARKDRPITARDGVEKLAQVRMPLYHTWADIEVDSQANPTMTAQAIADKLPPMI